MYDKQTILAIIDYLRVPSTSKKDDLKRRKELYRLLGLNPSGKQERFYKYLTGKLGEKIVEVYYHALNQDYKPKPKPIYCIVDDKKKRIMPDGEIFLQRQGADLQTTSFLVECKMRQYWSTGTSHEKIQGIAWKYHYTGKKIKLFLLADDEHKYNLDWTKLVRGDVEPKCEVQESERHTARLVIDEIILGTEIADALEKLL